jgi:phenylacetate-coenzyme A ligase PaaK-like adenylate-forming protein
VDFQPFKSEHGGPLLGRMLVTPLNNPWSYFVRFDTGDIVRLEESGRCGCGSSSGLILSSIEGRKINSTLTCSGRLVTLSEVDNVLSALQSVNMYKLTQTDRRSYDLVLVSPRPDKGRLAEEARNLLKCLYGRDADIDVIHSSDIAPENSGKYLVSRALFPIDLDAFLDKNYYFIQD